MAPKQHIVLVTGANRGLGYGIASQYLQRPYTTVVAAVRDVTSAHESLSSIATAEGSKIVIIKTDAISYDTTAAGLAELASQGYDHLDVVIANAGLGPSAWSEMIDTDLADMERMFKINGLGALVLFKSTLEMMRRAESARFVYISSSAGLFSAVESLRGHGFGSLGVGKAAGNFIVRRVAAENQDVSSFIIEPGLIATDAFVKINGGANGADTPEVCGEKLLKVVGVMTTTWTANPRSVDANSQCQIETSQSKTHHGRIFNKEGREIAF